MQRINSWQSIPNSLYRFNLSEKLKQIVCFNEKKLNIKSKVGVKELWKQ